MENRAILAGVLILNVIPKIASKLRFEQEFYAKKCSMQRNIVISLVLTGIFIYFMGAHAVGYVFGLIAIICLVNWEFSRGMLSGFRISEKELVKYLSQVYITLEYDDDSVVVKLKGEGIQ